MKIFKSKSILLNSYFIRKLRAAEHFYIDGAFIFPRDFKQLIVILYKDNNKNNEAGYLKLFTPIYKIITLENTKELNLKSFTTDFETGLINALKTIFPNTISLGCFYHYTRALAEKIKKMNLYNKKHKLVSRKLLNDLYKLPYIYAYN